MQRTRHTAMLATLAALTIASAPVAEAQDTVFDPMERGRELTQQFYAGELATVAAAMNAEMSAALGGEAGLRTVHAQVGAQLGAETEVLDESVSEAQAYQVYRRSARFEKFGGSVNVVWAFDDSGSVAGFSIQPAQSTEPAASRFLEYQTRVPLRLPFGEEWTVVWGGRSLAQNYHAAYTDQRFAYDILVARDGASHDGDGRSNENYHCFGLPILAPGAGVVAVAEDGQPDQTPGDIDASVAPGNHVVIDHGNDEYSFLAHMKEGSVQVSKGDSVAQGDTLGLCGNSGRSSEPHLHYHMQNTPHFGNGEGLPAQFLDYFANDSLVARGEPVKGQRVRDGG